MIKITASIVIFNTPKFQTFRLLNCLIDSNIIDNIYIIDNSYGCLNYDFTDYKNVIYIKSKNYGYGSGHNIALRKINNISDFHLIINPDVYFDSCQLLNLINRISLDDQIGLVMPKVLYPDGSIQYLCKMLPTPLNLFSRRFILPLHLLSNYFDKLNCQYELRFTEYNKEMNIPNLSGCFMFLRVSILNNIGLFDERFFMYAEDMDLTRRIHAKYKTLYFPDAVIYHEYAKTSYKSLKIFLIILCRL
jgi:GT2 family glycosyltransferase